MNFFWVQRNRSFVLWHYESKMFKTSTLTSPAPWKTNTFSDSGFSVIFKLVSIPATATAAVPESFHYTMLSAYFVFVNISHQIGQKSWMFSAMPLVG